MLRPVLIRIRFLSCLEEAVISGHRDILRLVFQYRSRCRNNLCVSSTRMNKLVYSTLIALCFIGFDREVDGARILGIFPLDAKSHFNMFERMMKALADVGHQVDVMSYFPQKEPYANYTDIKLIEIPTITMEKGITYEFIHSFKQSANVMIEMAGNSVCHLLEHPKLKKLIESPPRDPPYDLFITESFYGSCWYAFGRHLNVPVVALSSTSILPHANAPIGNPANTAFVSERSDGSIIHMDFWQRFKNTILTLQEILQFNYYSEVQSEIVKKHFGSDMPGVRDLERDVALLLVNSHHTLNGVRPMTPAVVEVGGMHIRDDDTKVPADLAKWLDDSTDGLIYFSFGTMIALESFPKATLEELYSGFAKIAPLRVLLRIWDPEQLPPGLPKNVFTMKWVPQISVLKHKNVRAFVTHGGLFGVLEAFAFGVPLIGIPVFADQPLTIKNCVDRGVAVSIDYKNLTADKFVAAVNAVNNDPKYRNNMSKLSKQFLDRPLNPLDTAVFWIEYILKHGSDALRSPAVKLTWWQLALLDVYGSLIIAVLATLYLIKLFLWTLFRKILTVKKTVPSSKKKN